MTTHHTSHSPLQCAFLFLLLLVLGCASGVAQTAESDPTGQPAMGPGGSRGTDTNHHEAGSTEASAPGMRDKMFLRGATAGTMEEIRLSELALQKSNSEDVKQFANMVIAGHQTVLDGLRSAAESQGVMLPTKLPPHEQAAFDRLNGLSGDEFDRDYTKLIAEAHHRDIKQFRAEAANTQDATLRAVAQNATDAIHPHIVQADQLARAKAGAASRPNPVAATPGPQ